MEKEEKVTKSRVTGRADERRPVRTERSERRERSYSDSSPRRSDTERDVREVREAGSDMWNGSCRLLSDLFYALGDSFTSSRRSSSTADRDTFDDEPGRGLGDCAEEFGVVCRTMSSSRSSRNRGARVASQDRYDGDDREVEEDVEIESSQRSTNRTATTNP